MEPPRKPSDPLPISYLTPIAPLHRPRVGRAIRYGCYSAVFALLGSLFAIVLPISVLRNGDPHHEEWQLVITGILMCAFFMGGAIHCFRLMRAAWRGEDRPM